MEDMQGTRRRRLDGFEIDRDQAWILRQRAQCMGRTDRIFIEMILDRGNSPAQIAHLTGQSEGGVRRRFGRLVARLASPQTLAALRSRRLSAEQREVGKAYYLEGLSKEAVARKTGTSEYFVRKTVRQMEAIAKQSIANSRNGKAQ